MHINDSRKGTGTAGTEARFGEEFNGDRLSAAPWCEQTLYNNRYRKIWSQAE